jgi:ABC-2 type transport system ATP-binding protein
MSTHQLHQVEELCDRIVLIDHGRTVLYGGLNDIRKQFTGHAVIVRTPNDLPALAGVEHVERHNSSAYRLNLSATTNSQDIRASWLKLASRSTNLKSQPLPSTKFSSASCSKMTRSQEQGYDQVLSSCLA